jgi:hypothetical protein
MYVSNEEKLLLVTNNVGMKGCHEDGELKHAWKKETRSQTKRETRRKESIFLGTLNEYTCCGR